MLLHSNILSTCSQYTLELLLWLLGAFLLGYLLRWFLGAKYRSRVAILESDLAASKARANDLEADLSAAKYDREKINEELIRQGKEFQLKSTWLTSEQVTALLSISRRTLQNYRDNGTLGFSAVGKKFYYRAAEIRELLERHYRPPFR